MRNGERTIDAAIASMLAQTYDDLEVLVVDDGSTDTTWFKLEQWVGRDARVRAVRRPARGLVATLNEALELARGELVARMDADDVSLPERLERSVAALDADPTLAAVGTGVEIVGADHSPSPNLQRYGKWLSSLTSPELVLRDRFIESPLCHPSVTFRREVVLRAGGYRHGPFPEDWELWLRLLEGGHRLSCLPWVLHRWSDHERRATRTDPRYSPDGHLRLKADTLARLLGRTPVTLWGATECGRAMSRALTARGVEVRRFVELNPRKVGQHIHGVPVLRPEAMPDDGSHVLSCVAAQGARDEIRAWLHQRGKLELRDFTCVA